MSFLVLPQPEQFYPEGVSVFVGLDKVSTESPALTAIYKDFQGALNFILKFKNFQGACKPCRFLVLVVNKKSLIKLHETLFVMYFFCTCIGG